MFDGILRIAFGSDERTRLTELIVQELKDLDKHLRTRNLAAAVEGEKGRE